MAPAQLFNAARALIRCGTDGRWWTRMYDLDTDESWWEAARTTPKTTEMVRSALRGELGFTHAEAREAVRLLRLRPESPATFVPGSQTTRPTEDRGTGNPGAVVTN